METPTRKGGTLPLHGAHPAFSCYPALRLYRLSKSQRGFDVVSLTLGNSVFPFGDCLSAHPQGFRDKFLGHFAAKPIFLQKFSQRFSDDLFFLSYLSVTILALQYPDSGKLSTDVPDVDTGIDWLVYLAQYSLQCQAQSRFVVRSRLDIVENTEIMAGPNQSFYCGTL